MKNRNRFITAALLGLSMVALSATAGAHDRDDGHYGGYRGHRWEHERYEHGYRGERVVERRYLVPEFVREPRYYEPVVYERAAPVYREPGVVVRIGLPPIIIR